MKTKILLILVFIGFFNIGCAHYIEPCKYEYKNCKKECSKLEFTCQKECMIGYFTCQSLKLTK